MAAGRSGLLHATTGSGKTYAVWFGALARAAALGVPRRRRRQPPAARRPLAHADARARGRLGAGDQARRSTISASATGASASAPATRPRPSGRSRTGAIPTALVTTPESLSLMLTREHAQRRARGVHTVIVDEWHELMGSKRGVQVQLALARLKRWNPRPRRLGPVGDARQPGRGDAGAARPTTTATMVRGRLEKNLVIDTLLPVNPGRFSWGGHLGKQMQQPVVEEIEQLGDDAGLRQHALAGRGLVPADPRATARVGRARRAAPRLARQGGARLGRARPEGRAAEGGGRDLVARPRRRLPAGRAGAADRLGQGRGAAAAARRPQRPCARPRQPRSRWCRPTRSSWSRRSRPAARRWPAASRSARPPTSRSTCWCSTW